MACEDIEIAQDIARMVKVAAEHGPFAANCLRKSLVLIKFLHARKLPCKLILGARFEGEEFGAHAWVECNGQTLADAASVYDGQTIPNLNSFGGGTKRFLRGSTSSGNLGGSESHSHGIWQDEGMQGAIQLSFATGAEHIPPFYEVVWIMKVR